MSRKTELEQALREARRLHAEEKTSASFHKVRECAGRLNWWNRNLDRLQAQFREALSLGEKARIRGLIEAHHEPRGAAVNLVDTAGVLRLDANGHRAHMTYEQGLDLFLQLAVTLRGRAGQPSVACDYNCHDEVRVSNDVHGRCAEIQIVEHDDGDHGRDLMVNLSSEKAVQIAVELAAVAVEVKHNG